MEVTLSKHAWHVNFYQWATGNKPKWNNLCPYFWSLVFMLLISPLIIIWKIVKFILVKPIKKLLVQKTPIKKKVKKEREPFISYKTKKNINKVLFFIGKVFVFLYFTLVGLIAMYGIYILFKNEGLVIGMKTILAFIGGITVFTAIIFGIISYFTSDTHQMITGMIKSKKDKICPFINWKE